MKVKCVIAALLLTAAGGRTTWAQKMLIHKTDSTIIEFEMAEVDSMVFVAVTIPSYLTCPYDNHPHAIDLGLPSGTKWACCNVGANAPEEYGGYYAWGETSKKDYYSRESYKYDDYGWTKYCTHSDYGCNGFTDGKTELDLSDDVARVRMGAPWRMPSIEQTRELYDYCSKQWTQQNGVNGILVTGLSGGQIFLPAAGCRWNDYLYGEAGGIYWSRSLYLDHGNNASAYCLYFNPGDWYWDFYWERYSGLFVRPICP